jgi:hypothetical protein
MGTSKQEVSSNPFATPVEERRATPALPRKPLSLWIAQVVVGSEAPLGLFAIWRLTKQGAATPRSVLSYALLALVASAIVFGVQARKRWARLVLILTLLFMLAAFSIELRDREQTSILFVSWLLWGGLTLSAGFGKKARAYFASGARR